MALLGWGLMARDGRLPWKVKVTIREAVNRQAGDVSMCSCLLEWTAWDCSGRQTKALQDDQLLRGAVRIDKAQGCSHHVGSSTQGPNDLIQPEKLGIIINKLLSWLKNQIDKRSAENLLREPLCLDFCSCI
jgi:hypothetical protein